MRNNTKLTFTYAGEEYTGKVNNDVIYWDEFSYENILQGATDGYTKVTHGSKSFSITFHCNRRLSDGTPDYYLVVMNFEKK